MKPKHVEIRIAAHGPCFPRDYRLICPKVRAIEEALAVVDERIANGKRVDSRKALARKIAAEDRDLLRERIEGRRRGSERQLEQEAIDACDRCNSAGLLLRGSEAFRCDHASLSQEEQAERADVAGLLAELTGKKMTA